MKDNPNPETSKNHVGKTVRQPASSHPHSLESNDEIERLATVYDKYRNSPSTQKAWSMANPGNQAIYTERHTGMQQLLQQEKSWPLDDYSILEVGCGSGNVLAGFRQWGAQSNSLHGIDLLPERIESAQKQYPHLHFYCQNAEHLNFDNECFDIVVIFTVFSSILDPAMAQNVAGEIDRVLSPTGVILWYDFRYNNPRNPHVHGMNQSSIQQLFPNYSNRLKTITLLPPLARRLGKLTPILYPLLSVIPPLRTHYLGLLQKPSP